MKSSIFLGSQIGTLSFTHFATYRDYKYKYANQLESSITRFFEKSISINQVCYVMEKDRYTGYNHSHLLLDITDANIFLTELKNNFSIKKSESGSRDQIIKLPTSITSKSSNVIFKDTRFAIPFEQFYGKSANIHLEQIISTLNASDYIHKFCGYGTNYGYLKKTPANMGSFMN